MAKFIKPSAARAAAYEKFFDALHEIVNEERPARDKQQSLREAAAQFSAETEFEELAAWLEEMYADEK